MTLLEFKAELQAEHERDKRLTYMYFGIVTLLIVSVLVYLAVQIGPRIYINATSNDDVQYMPSWMKFVLPLIPLSLLIYPLYKLYTVTIRKEKIDDLIAKLQNGAIASEITNTKEYRVFIPLYIVNFNLYPIEYIHITLSAPNFAKYSLPVPVHFIPEIKSILSGANMQAVNKAWYELATGKGTPTNVTTDKIKSVEEFRNFVNTDLSSNLQSIETTRKSTKKKYLIGAGIGITIMLAWFGFQYFIVNKGTSVDTSNMTGEEINNQTNSLNNIIIPVFSVLMGIYYVGYMYYNNIKKKQQQSGKEVNFDFEFKTKILERMIKFINPNFQYILHGHIGIPEFLDSGLFQNKSGYEIGGNDQILGTHNGVPFQYCDVNVQHQSSWSSEKEGPAEVFTGQFFIARFNKSFLNPIYITPKSNFISSFKENSIKDYINDLGSKIQLEDPEFMKMYDVHGNDQIEARYILTPAMIQRIKDLSLRTKGKYFIAFNYDKITIANNNRENKFEASLFTSLTKESTLEGFYKDLCDQFAIIDELKLNINIWKQN